jgi:hypothetical protein
VSLIDQAPAELADAIREFWPSDQWDNAAAIAQLESGWSAFAEFNTTSPGTPCGHRLADRDGVKVTAERSIGWYQINCCNLPADWNPAHLFNTRHNCGTAHMLWERAGGWSPWYFSAKTWGLL